MIVGLQKTNIFLSLLVRSSAKWLKKCGEASVNQKLYSAYLEFGLQILNALLYILAYSLSLLEPKAQCLDWPFEPTKIELMYSFCHFQGHRLAPVLHHCPGYKIPPLPNNNFPKCISMWSS